DLPKTHFAVRKTGGGNAPKKDPAAGCATIHEEIINRVRIITAHTFRRGPILIAYAHRFLAATMATRPSKTLETFSNPAPQRDYLVHIEIPEGHFLSPLHGEPDFATLLLDYVAD